MAQTPKRLGALTSTGTITTPDILYTCVTTAGIVTTIAVCNTSSSTDLTYRICISAANTFPTSPSVTGYIVYGNTVAANSTEFIPVGLTMDLNNKYLLCSASGAAVAFSAFGFEVS